MKRNTLWFLITLFGLSTLIKAQEKSSSENYWELAPSFIGTYPTKDKETLFATELYTIYWFHEKWGAGISNTAKFKNNILLWDMAFLGSYKVVDWMNINSGLNVGFPHDKVRNDLEPGFYLESEFNFKLLEKAHFGLVLGSVISRNTELTAGIHFGFEFPANKPMK